MAEKEEKKDETAKGGKKKLIIIIAAALVLLLAAGGGAYYFLVYKPHQEELKRKQEEASKAEALIKPVPEEAKIGPMVEIKEFIVNIISEDTPHYVKASLSLELDKDATLDEVNKRMPQIRDAILLLIGNKTFEELQDIQGKNQVKAELKSKINSFLKTGKVNNVYLTDFVVQ
ncbi:flagellar basal body-associated protein FliL [Desulfobulbus propionicus DSM 2032]|jgi:flagellar FliL protein|uniref:Flagellar protein FliL n=1 Tax=Desulfobulbus propionicus (strain ATCC 33891 / DSM 2032 / VKM B-1956 / 1pr3) TaxID=577650 RepID=A0A7U4DPQ0_DESPD|nr:flagellar basal body-associated FliL family protein [Desulfobulbus propionicus]ADW18376.1 flagellar basal body-associated protein FliL [Desulfobulbus propionicus DSM 2032]